MIRMNTHTRRHSAQGRTRHGNPVRAILGTAGTTAAAVAIALLGTGTSYALWSGEVPLGASAVSSGSTGLTVNGVSSYSLTGLDLARLAPGQSAIVPIRLANTGTTALSIVPSAEVTTQANALGDHLLLALSGGSVCGTTTVATPSGSIAALGAGIDPYLVGAGNSLDLCLSVALSRTAPATVQGGSATFTLTLDAVQERATR